MRIKALIQAVIALCALSVPAFSQHMNAKDAPCQQAGSTAESANCFDNAAKDADKKLNRLYGRIQKLLQSDKRTEDSEALRKSQRAWIVYRDANCAAARGLYEGGTAAPVTYFACLEANTRQRTQDLTAGFGWLLDR